MTDSSRPSGLHPLALDVWVLEDVPPLERCLLEVIAFTIEAERERLRPELGKQPPTARGFSPKSTETDVVDLMTWEDLLLGNPELTERCADSLSLSGQQKAAADVMDAIRKYCSPGNGIAFFWMHQFFKLKNEFSGVAAKFTVKAISFKKSKDQSNNNSVNISGRDALKKKIRAEWATGEYVSYKDCASKQWENISVQVKNAKGVLKYFKFESVNRAQLALAKAPDPNPWPAKERARFVSASNRAEAQRKRRKQRRPR